MSSQEASSQQEARRYGEEIRRLLAEHKQGEALDTFFRVTGMPDELVHRMHDTPMWAGLLALAPTLAYDSAVMGDIERGGAVPKELAVQATRPGLVLAGGDSPPFMLNVGRRLADLLPKGQFRVLEGQSHVVATDVLAPIVADFLAGR